MNEAIYIKIIVHYKKWFFIQMSGRIDRPNQTIDHYAEFRTSSEVRGSNRTLPCFILIVLLFRILIVIL